MKKSLKLLVMPAAMLLLAGNITSCTATEKLVAMISDVGDIDDGSFNQSCWEGVKGYCRENNITYDYYRPFADSDFARRCAIKQAVAKGAKIIVMPGFKFKGAAKEASLNKEYKDKDIKFVLIDDVVTTEEYTETEANLVCFTYDFVYSGWLAGYAVAKDYYNIDYAKNKKLNDRYGFGFVGGNNYASVYPFGYGFIEGIIYATGEFTETHINCNKPLLDFKTNYAGAFMQDDLTCANVKGWLTNEKEPIQCVFPCGGKLYQSITEAVKYYNEHKLSNDKRNFKDQEAPREAARWVGVDGDQYKLLQDEDDKKSIYTSALKDLGHTVRVCISKCMNDQWASLRGQGSGCYNIGLDEDNIILESETSYDYVGIPLETKSDKKTLRSFNTIQKDDIVEKKGYLSRGSRFGPTENNTIMLYDGKKDDQKTKYKDSGGDFKSIASKEFKEDNEINTLKDENGNYLYKYTNYIIE